MHRNTKDSGFLVQPSNPFGWAGPNFKEGIGKPWVKYWEKSWAEPYKYMQGVSFENVWF